MIIRIATILVTIGCLFEKVSAQTSIGVVTFGLPTCSLPAGITKTAYNDWLPDDGTLFVVPQSSGYSGASASCFLAARDGNYMGTTATMTYTLSTLGYDNIKLTWGQWCNSNVFPAINLEYSLNGTTYSPITTFTPSYSVLNFYPWSQFPIITLPMLCDNATVLHLRWSFIDDGNASIPMYVFDDIKVTGSPIVTGINAPQINGLIAIYPNPSSGFFTIKTPTLIKIKIYDPYGKMIATEILNEGENTIILNSFSEGIYTVQMVTDKDCIISKIIIK